MELEIRHIDDLVRYDPQYKIVRLLYNGYFYDATLAGSGIESIPRPDMFSALWITSTKIRPVDLNKVNTPTNFSRIVSVAILYPKSLVVEAKGSGYSMSALTSGSPSSYTQSKGSNFYGVYNRDGSSYGIYIQSDGSILIQGSGGSITIGPNGIDIKGQKITTSGIVKDEVIFKDNPLSFLPSFAANPIPKQVLDLDFIDTIKNVYDKLIRKFV